MVYGSAAHPLATIDTGRGWGGEKKKLKGIVKGEQANTSGKRAAFAGGGVLLGDDDSPLPNMFGTMMQ